MNESLQRYFNNISKEDVSAWLYVVKNNEEEAKVLFKYLSDNDFNFYSSQMEEICRGLKNLSADEIKLYANPKFNIHQMRQIRFGIEEGLPIEKVKIYANEEYDYLGMGILRKALKYDCVNVEKVIEYIKAGFNQEQLEEIVEVMIMYSESDAELIAKKEYTAEYMQVIHKYIANYMDRQCIKKWIDKGLTAEQLEFVLGTILGYKFDDSQVSIFANPKFNIDQMKAVELGLERRLDINDVKFYAKPEFDAEQMKVIRNFLQFYDLSIEQIKPYAVPEFDSKQMNAIFNGIKDGLDVSVYANRCYDHRQMNIIAAGLKDGIDVTLYIDEDYTAYQMQRIYTAIKDGYDKEKLDIIANPDLSVIQMDLIKEVFERGASVEEVKQVINSNNADKKLQNFLEKGSFEEKCVDEREELISLLS